jgi:septum formation protein
MRIILASTSPRRIELMKQVGLVCEVIAPNADETPRRGEKPAALVARLAREKAASVASTIEGNSIIVAADTIVVDPSGRKILGKPTSVADARKMLSMLAGRKHTVLTGYCISETGENAYQKVRVVKSTVVMRKLSRAQIEAYVATGEPMDKAGSYAAQGLGMALIEKINGSYANVVGLPVSQLWMDLETHFGMKAFMPLAAQVFSQTIILSGAV